MWRLSSYTARGVTVHTVDRFHGSGDSNTANLGRGKELFSFEWVIVVLSVRVELRNEGRRQKKIIATNETKRKCAYSYTYMGHSTPTWRTFDPDSSTITPLILFFCLINAKIVVASFSLSFPLNKLMPKSGEFFPVSWFDYPTQCSTNSARIALSVPKHMVTLGTS